MINHPAPAHQKLPTYLLIGIILLAIGVRFWHFPQTIRWEDAGMELLRAFHLRDFGEFPLLGVPALSINFFHPPLYIYMLGFITKIIPNITILLAFSVLLHGVSALGLYSIAANYWGTKVGIISALIYALNPYIVQFSYSLQSQNIIVPFVIISIAYWTIAQKTNNTFFQYTAIFFLVFVSSINYASLLLLLWVFIMDLYTVRSVKKVFIPHVWIWITSIIICYIPLGIYVGQQLIKKESYRMFSGTSPYTFSSVYHYWVLAPGICVIPAILCVYIYKNIHGPWKQRAFVIGAACITICWLSQIILSRPSGDYLSTRLCSQTLGTYIKQTGLSEDFSLVVRDPNHTNEWDYIIIFIEEILHKKFVSLSEKRDYYHWIQDGSHVILLCLPDRLQQTNAYIQTICLTRFQKDYPTYQFISNIPLSPSLACSAYRFDRNER